MASLGSLGRPKQVVDLDFDYFGETIRLNPLASDLVEIDFMEQAARIDLDGVDLNAELNSETMALMTRAAKAATDAAVGSVRRLIHPDDWGKFWRLSITHGQNLVDLMEIQKEIQAALVEATTGFPTGPSSDSPPGAASTPEKSVAGSPSPAALPLSPPAGASTADKALAMLRKRPDLQEFVVMNEEAEATRNGKTPSVT
jgi:hypothetical protein